MKLWRIILPVLVLAVLVASCSRATKADGVAKQKGRLPSSQILIVLDAGHGGHDPGAQSKRQRYEEKRLALATALMVRDHLERLGYRVLMTRQDDTFIPLTKRAEIANRAKASLFVSMHFNSSPNRKAQGVEIYFYDPGAVTARSKLSKGMASDILRRVVRYTEASNRGVKTAGFAVIRKTKMPAVLVEGGFLTNSHELKKLKNTKYLNKLAWGIAKGLDDFLKDEG